MLFATLGQIIFLFNTSPTRNLDKKFDQRQQQSFTTKIQWFSVNTLINPFKLNGLSEAHQLGQSIWWYFFHFDLNFDH